MTHDIKAVVWVVDDDEPVRESLGAVLKSLGHEVRLFAPNEVPEKVLTVVVFPIPFLPNNDTTCPAWICRLISNRILLRP